MGLAARKLRMTAPAAAGGLPVDGSQVWFDASQITGKSNGDTLSTWLDESGNGRDATAPSGEEPTYQTSVINGLPVVRFSASSSKRMATTAFGVAVSQPYTAFIVGNTANTSYSTLMDGIASGNRAAYYRNTTAGSASMYAGAGGGSYSLGDMHVASIHAVTFNNASSRMRRGGGAGVSPGTIGTNTLTGLTLGNQWAATFYAGGDIAEVSIFASMSLADMNLIGDYLADKYALSWATAT